MRITRRGLIGTGAAALAAGAGGAWILRGALARSDLAQLMTPPEAHAAAASGALLLVDIRRPDEWAATGVPEHGAPIDMRAEDFAAQLQAARSGPTQPVGVICARGVRSARLTRRLAEAGIGPIIDIPEGMLGSVAGPGWLARALPVTPYPT